MITKRLVGIVAVLILSLISTATPGVRPHQLERGGEWLSWSPVDRARYVNGFISGYLRGFHEACDVTDELFEVAKPGQRVDARHTNDRPSSRCLDRMDEYSKVRYAETSGLDVSTYTNVITEFYTKHPEYQDIPFPYLMEFLRDSKYATADQLYEMALKGEIRTNF